MSLYLPSGLRVPSASRARPPTGIDIRLEDRRLLRHIERWTTPPPEDQDGHRYQGPQRLVVIATSDQTPAFGTLLHVSLSYPDRDPDWQTIKLVKAAFFGDIDVMMVLPRAADYVDIHHHCFHLWETPETWRLM